jgi:hypothetical protein
MPYQSSNVQSIGRGYSDSWIAPFVFKNVNGFADYHIPEVFSFLTPFHWESEFTFNHDESYSRLSRLLPYAAFYASMLYVVMVFGGQYIMQSFKPLNLKWPLAVWNLFLSIFSVVGAVRVIPHLFYGLYSNEISYFFCRNSYNAFLTGPSGLWMLLFVWSKFFELIDTAFLVLRKKSVPFLHWYHHATVLMYCWDSVAEQMPSGILFGAMNFFVHSIMYSYYFLSGVCDKPPKWGKFVTIIQIVQMVLGFFFVVLNFYFKNITQNCHGSMRNITLAFLMYSSYLFLFVQFFINRYKKKVDKKNL